VFPAFSSREVTLGQMRKIGIHFIIHRSIVAAAPQDLQLSVPQQAWLRFTDSHLAILPAVFL